MSAEFMLNSGRFTFTENEREREDRSERDAVFTDISHILVRKLEVMNVLATRLSNQKYDVAFGRVLYRNKNQPNIWVILFPHSLLILSHVQKPKG